MMIFQKKQIVMLSLIFLVVIAGYLQYTYNKGSVSTTSGKLGDSIYVDNNSTETASGDKKEISSNSASQATDKEQASSKDANDFFVKARMDKEITRGKNKESLKEITSNAKASKEEKQLANEKMIKLVSNSEKEMKIETMVKEKGFKDVFSLFADDESLDIVVRAPNLSSSQVAQIANVASRQGNISIGNIHIKNIY